MLNGPQPVIVQPGSGENLSAFGNVLSVLLSGDDTAGKIAVMSELTPPGGGPPLHVHSQEDEIFLVTEGRISYFACGAWTEVGVGGVVYLPVGAIHTYRNIGDAASQHWIITVQSDFEKFFAECAAEFASPGGPDDSRILEIHHRHGSELLQG